MADLRTNYRPDIDGLRAIAVLSVIVFHLREGLLPGGFLGVDVFFVISGFLITGNIVQELDHGRFSVLDFYRRRVKRIAPAMLVVVACTLLGAQLLMLPGDARATARSALFSLVSAANVYFCYYTDTGYFAADSRQTPLLHLWSLGVEEQFYILWPWILLACYRPARGRVLAGVLSGVALLSFLTAELLYGAAPSFVYYMLPTRAGELLFGAILAIAAGRSGQPRLSGRWRTPLSVAGIAMLLGSLALISENHPIPGWYALPATLGTALIILAGIGRESAVSRALSWPPLVWVGLVSYSAYLWHWPLLALYRYGYGDIGAGAAVALFSLTLALAWASYRCIELPARRSRTQAVALIVRQYLLPAAVLGVLALCLTHPARFGVRLSSRAYLARLDSIRSKVRPAYEFDWVCEKRRLAAGDLVDGRCVLGPASAGEPRAILWGDSNAAHYIGMISAFAAEAGFRFRNIEADDCPPLAGDPQRFLAVKERADCRESLRLERALADSFPVVILAASWDGYREDLLPDVISTASAFAGAGKLVIVLGRAPRIVNYDRRCPEKALTFPLLRCLRVAPLTREVGQINARLRAFAERTPNVRYFDATPYLCPAGQCRVLDPDGVPRYFDSGHLSVSGSLELGREIVAREGVPAPFRLIPDWQPGGPR